MESDRDELLRLRERLHDAETRLVGLELHARELLRWRAQVDPIIADLREADRIAEAVARKMNELGAIHVTRLQAAVAVVAVVTSTLFAAASLALKLAGVL